MRKNFGRLKKPIPKFSKRYSVTHIIQVGHLNIYNSSVRDERFLGGGCHFSKKKSKLAANGEYLERLAFNSVKISARKKTFLELKSYGKNVFNPAEFNLYLSEQIEKNRSQIRNYRKSDLLNWTYYRDTQTDKSILLPTEWSTYRNYFGKPGYLASTTGNASGESYTSASVSAILEIIERDAMMFYWRTQASPIKIVNWESKFEKLTRVFKGIPKTAEVQYFHFQTDMPTYNIFCVYYDRNPLSKIRFAITGASRLDPKKAMEKASLELFQSLSYIGSHFSFKIQYDQDLEKSILSFPDHALLYAFSKNKYSRIIKRFMNSAKRELDFATICNRKGFSNQESFSILINSFKELGLRLYLKEITSKAFVPTKASCVVRAFSPDVAHMEFVHRCRMLGNARYRQLSKKMKMKKNFSKYSDFNHMPHPFP